MPEENVSNNAFNARQEAAKLQMQIVQYILTRTDVPQNLVELTKKYCDATGLTLQNIQEMLEGLEQNDKLKADFLKKRAALEQTFLDADADTTY